MMRYASAIMALSLGIGLIDSSAGRDVLVLNTPTAPPLTRKDGTGFIDRVAGEAFRRCGIELKQVRLPAERALRNANAGIDDGDLVRIAGMEKIYPNLVRVPERIMEMHFTAFSRHRDIRTDSWSGLRSYRVGIIKGWKIYERSLRGIAVPTLVDDADQLFNLLERDRVDVVLYARWLGEQQLRDRGLKDGRALEPPLAIRDMFIYLHKKHAGLVDKLAAALRSVKADGTYQRAYNETVGPLIRSAQ